MKILKMILAVTCFSALLGADNRVVNLVPPQLNPEAIAAEVACVRPVREGSFNISSTYEGGKFIVHCYGHGGCGWTTFMGSVEKAIELLQVQYPVPEMAPPVRIIGSGCMGLCSAIDLTSKGFKVAGITTKDMYNIPSWNAAGYFAVVSVKTSPEEEESVKRICLSTLKSYQKIEKDEHPYLSSKAVRFLPVYCSEGTHSGVEELEEQGLIPAKEVVDLDFGNGITHRNFNKYMTYFFDVTTLMQELHKEVTRLQIPIELKKIGSFGEVQEEIIFNCAGLEGGQLANDSNVSPVRGHLLMLNKNAGQEHMDYMIYTKMMYEGKEEYVYLFPRTLFISSENPEGNSCYGVVGGTFIPGFDKLPADELADLDQREFDRLLDRNSLFFHGISLKQ